MGQTQSSVDNRGMFLVGKPGDTFTFTIPNVVDAWSQKNGTPTGDRFTPFAYMKEGSTYKHLIFSGTLAKEISPGVFMYDFNSVTASDKLDDKNGKPTWTAGPDKADWWMSGYLQSRDRDENGYRKPPTITGGPKGNLVPIVMNSQSTPGFKLDGDLGDLKPAQIYKLMNDYATQSLSVVTPSHPFYDEIVEVSKSYTSNDQIRQAFADTRQKMRRMIGNPRAVLITEDKTGVVRTDTTVNDFIEKPFKAITRGDNKETKYVGVEIDVKKDFEGDYNNLQSSLDAYWEDVVAKHGDEAVMPGVDFRGDVVLDVPDTNIPLVKNIRCKAYKTLLGRIRQLGMAGNHIDGWTQRRTEDGGRIETTFYRRVFPASTSRRLRNSVSGTVRGAEGMKTVEDQVRSMEGAQTTAYKSMLEKDARFSPEKIRAVRSAYISTLAMMVAFQRLNPGQNSLIRSIGIAMGNDGRLVDGINAPTMWKYSQVMAAVVKSVDSAVSDKVHRDSSSSVEGFMSGMPAPFASVNSRGFESGDHLDTVTTRPRAKLLNTLEQNEAIVEKLAGAYTSASIQFAGMVAAAGVFVAITLLPKTAQ